MAADRRIEVATSKAIIDETVRILRQKFQKTELEIDEARTMMTSLSLVVTPSQTLTVVASDPDDNRVVECAVESGSNLIITGDRHLLNMDHYKGIKVLRVSHFLDLIESLANT